jgi:WXG100 family type VII secretion target
MADRIEADYQKLADIKQRFEDLSQDVRDIRVHLRQASDPLVEGGWEGKGSSAFKQEMMNVIYPSLERLEKALADSGTTLNTIGQKFREAEEEAGKIEGAFS